MQHLNDFAALMIDRRVSLISKLFFIMLVGAYILLPLDLIPDILLPLGIVDDGGLLLAAMSLFTRQARKQIERNAPPMSEAKNGGAADGQGAHSPHASGNSELQSQSQSDESQSHSPRSSGNSRGCLNVLGIIGGIVGIIALVAVALFFVAPAAGVAFISNLFNLPPSTAQAVSTRTIVNHIQPLGQLVTISAEVAKADIAVSVTTGRLNLCGHSANHVAHGVIEAGIDFAAIAEDNLSYDADSESYALTLPPASITSCRIEYIRQYERRGGGVGCNVDWDRVRLLAQHKAMSDFVSDMLEGGLRGRAEAQAELVIGTFVSSLTDKSVHVQFAEADEAPKWPSSCQSELPSGWSFNEESGVWVKTGR